MAQRATVVPVGATAVAVKAAVAMEEAREAERVGSRAGATVRTPCTRAGGSRSPRSLGGSRGQLC